MQFDIFFQCLFMGCKFFEGWQEGWVDVDYVFRLGIDQKWCQNVYEIGECYEIDVVVFQNDVDCFFKCFVVFGKFSVIDYGGWNVKFCCLFEVFCIWLV